MIVSLLFFKNTIGMLIFAFGLGHFISDLADFLNLKFYGSDGKEHGKVRFWHID